MSELFPRIIEMSLMGSVVILITILTRFILRKRSKSFIMILWAVVAIRLLVPFSIESAISVFNLIPSNTQSITEQKETVEAVIPDVNYASGKTYAADNVVQTNVVQTANENNAVQAAPEMKTQAEDQHVSVSNNKELTYAERIEEPSVLQKRAVRFTMPDIRTVLGIVWLTGAAGILTYCSVRYINLKKRLKDSKKIHDNVYISKKVKSPFVFGFFIPKIYLPEAFENSEKEYILMHERTHIKYGDWITKIIGMVIVAVHWFNPLVWIAYALFEQDIEMRCDEVTISNLDSDLRQAYTLSLISYAKKSNSKTYLVTPLGFSKVNFSKMEVTNRVKNIVYFKQGKKITAIFITAVLLFVAAACGLNSKTGKEAPEEKTEPEVTETTAPVETINDETEEIPEPTEPVPTIKDPVDVFSVFSSLRELDVYDDDCINDKQETYRVFKKAAENIYSSSADKNMLFGYTLQHISDDLSDYEFLLLTYDSINGACAYRNVDGEAVKLDPGDDWEVFKKDIFTNCEKYLFPYEYFMDFPGLYDFDFIGSFASFDENTYLAPVEDGTYRGAIFGISSDMKYAYVALGPTHSFEESLDELLELKKGDKIKFDGKDFYVLGNGQNEFYENICTITISDRLDGNPDDHTCEWYWIMIGTDNNGKPENYTIWDRWGNPCWQEDKTRLARVPISINCEIDVLVRNYDGDDDYSDDKTVTLNTSEYRDYLMLCAEHGKTEYYAGGGFTDLSTFHFGFLYETNNEPFCRPVTITNGELTYMN